jgi:hypothetical protein
MKFSTGKTQQEVNTTQFFSTHQKVNKTRFFSNFF